MEPQSHISPSSEPRLQGRNPEVVDRPPFAKLHSPSSLQFTREGYYYKRSSVTKMSVVEMEIPGIIVPYRLQNILVYSNIAEMATENAISYCQPHSRQGAGLALWDPHASTTRFKAKASKSSKKKGLSDLGAVAHLIPPLARRGCRG